MDSVNKVEEENEGKQVGAQGREGNKIIERIYRCGTFPLKKEECV